MTIEKYLDKFKDKAEIMDNYSNYIPKSKYLKRIGNILTKNPYKLRIFTMGTEWCHDCQKKVPAMVKIVKILNSDRLEMKILYGIKVNAFRKKGEILWDIKHSPPESFDPKFNLNAIPTFFIFKDNELIGRIVEESKRRSALERDLMRIIKKQF
jgi:thiol-disulfide isomerase/thioredoxin